MDLLVTQGKYLGIILFLVLTGCGLPIPEEVPIVLAGVLSSKVPPLMDPWLAYFSCLIGALLGDSAMYAIGYHWGHGLVKDHPRLGKFLHAEREERFEQAVQRHGFKVMLLARFMVGVRGPAYLAAGVVRMPFRRFLLMDLVAATVVVSLFFSVAYAFGDRIVKMIVNAEMWFTVIVGLVVLIVVAVIYRRRRRKFREAIDETATVNVADTITGDTPPGEIPTSVDASKEVGDRTESKSRAS